MEDFFFLDPNLTDPSRMKRERERARKMRKSGWWSQKLSQGYCEYCGGRFSPEELTMDHVVPLARGGASTKGNLVPACQSCNQEKKLATPAERILKSEETR